MFLQQMIKAIAAGWKWIVSMVLIAACISLAISATSVPEYRSEATFVIAPNKDLPSSRDVVSAFTALDTLKIFSTYSDILASNRVYEEAVKNVEMDAAELSRYTRYTEMKPESIILQLFVEGPDAQRAATLANEIGKYGIQFINAYFTVFEIDFLDQAVPAVKAFKPQTTRDMGIFAGIGLITGILIVVMKDFMEIPLAQFVHRFSIDQESLANTRRSIEKSLTAMKEKGDAWPLTFILIKIKNLQDLFSILPAFSRRKISVEIVARMKTQLKGGDLVGKWNASTFCVVLPNTPEKVASIPANKLVGTFKDPFVYGVEGTEHTTLEAAAATTTCNDAGDFEKFIHKAEMKIKDLEL